MARKKPIPPKNIAQKIREFAQPEVEALGLTLWDVTFEKAGTLYELTLFIDRPDRAISTDDCEAVSRRVDPLLDQYDPIEDSYTFYVSSTGHPRTLRTPAHFQWAMGREIVVKLYQAVDGVKELAGTLRDYNADTLTLETAAGERRIAAAEMASARTPAPELNDLPEDGE